MIYVYQIIIINLYILFEVIVRKKSKTLLIALIPSIAIILTKHTKLVSIIPDDARFIIFIGSCVLTVILSVVCIFNMCNKK